MGGVAGHMDHLYDNPNLTFEKMVEIMEAASNGELSAEEKVDGQNLFLSYSIPEGKAKGARNKGNYRSGGLDAEELAKKFAGRGGLTKAFTDGFGAFEKAAESLSLSEKQRIFGPDANIWYNSEIMDPGTPDDPQDQGSTNVIKYDSKTLKIHDVGHFLYDPETNTEKEIPEGALETLDGAYDRMQNALKGQNFSLARKAIIQLKRLEDDNIIKQTKSKLNKALADEGMNLNNTVQEYMFARLINGMDSDLPRELKNEITKYLLRIPGNVGLRALKKGLNQENLQDLTNIINSKKMILLDSIRPIEMIVHDFTVEILKGLKSIFIADSDKEIIRLKEELAMAVKEITEHGSENPAAMNVLQRHLHKIKDFSNITTPVEAVVFDYDGHTYKFAGNYAPLNQILGLFRYGGLTKKLTSENINFDTQVVTENNGKTVALLPGGFKPPHAGHYGLAKELSSLPEIDEVIVIIGKNPRSSKVDPSVIVTAEQSKNLWDIYTRKDKNITVKVQEGKTPVADVYDMIADKKSFSEGDTVVLGKSDKDVGDTRYARAQSYAEMHNPGVNVEEIVFPMIGGKGMGGTQLRNLIAVGQKESFVSKLPDHLSEKEKEEAWELLNGASNESLNSIIDSTLDEISSMGGMSVQGYSTPVGSKKTVQPYRRSKKPKLNRPKRQRRR